jgi:hypothetical protein
MIIHVGIKGVTPFLFNRFTEEAEGSTSSGTSPVQAGDKGTPRDQADKTAYKDSKTGELYIPGPNIFAGLIEAGRFHKIGREKVTTTKTSIIPAAIQMNNLTCTFGTTKFEVDSRRIVNPSTKGARLRHRARLDEWATEFTIEVDDKMMSEDLVRKLVDDAGRKIGLGDFRPSRKGPFGRFVVTKWKVEKN